MGRKTLNIVLTLALAGLFLSATGCDLRSGRSQGGSYSDVLFAFDWLGGYGGYDVIDTYVEDVYYQEDIIFFDSGGDYYYEDDYYYGDDFYYDDYDDGDYYYYDYYYEDDYWDDDGKRKRRG